MYRTLVPGLTNVTNRLRYYSYFCWVARRYEHAHHADDEQRWSRFIRRAEALFALATQLADIEGTDGLAGSDWATAMLKSGVAESFDLGRHTDSPGERGGAQYLQARFGNFGQFYKRSMTEVGFLDASERIPIVNKQRGDPLADAFEESIGAQNRQLVIAALDSGRVRKSDLLKIGNAMHPAR